MGTHGINMGEHKGDEWNKYLEKVGTHKWGCTTLDQNILTIFSNFKMTLMKIFSKWPVGQFISVGNLEPTLKISYKSIKI